MVSCWQKLKGKFFFFFFNLKKEKPLLASLVVVWQRQLSYIWWGNTNSSTKASLIHTTSVAALTMHLWVSYLREST